ncbi:Hemolysin-type calcium-binding repeat-containing protein [Syntrophus gentianae]|uniref:Hemolysin-type calcium-binding repeat-containing protein n=1 Tax=Syntrophus gentianae TaxID=43775 RepID=A0A1H7YL82_9BACT|nr:calcium-binding protein [Syntrophus gentianae]SEM46890.1 Hemolysin-type calcium-binding repeat-containing protein [Syntrophus gentianae]
MAVIKGDNLPNTLKGTESDDTIYGYGGNDILYGYGGNDTLDGGTGNDYMAGGDGKDKLKGGAGNDTLNGGLGNDMLTGGDGLDLFDFTTALNATTNKDTITDFSVIDDTIRLENSIMTGLGTTTGVLAAGAFHSGTVNTATQADDRIIYNTSTGGLFYDADGTGLTAGVQIVAIGSTTHPALAHL